MKSKSPSSQGQGFIRFDGSSHSILYRHKSPQFQVVMCDPQEASHKTVLLAALVAQIESVAVDSKAAEGIARWDETQDIADVKVYDPAGKIVRAHLERQHDGEIDGQVGFAGEIVETEITDLNGDPSESPPILELFDSLGWVGDCERQNPTRPLYPPRK